DGKRSFNLSFLGDRKAFFFTGFCQIFYLFIYFSHLNLIVGVDLSLVFCIIYEGEKQFFEKNR
ncbi:hypothetical protein, partial [Enterococcus innesii]|uniref:hypothetical protein n=1 Tax=Enterococcus innesii TaxID=2839759 RepID=UPI00232DA66E